MNKVSPRLISLVRRHYRMTEELAESLAAAIATRNATAQALIAAANSEDKVAFTHAVFAADRAEAVRKKTAEDYARSRTDALPVFRQFFEAWCAAEGVSVDGEDVEADLRASLRVIAGGKS